MAVQGFWGWVMPSGQNTTRRKRRIRDGIRQWVPVCVRFAPFIDEAAPMIPIEINGAVLDGWFWVNRKWLGRQMSPQTTGTFKQLADNTKRKPRKGK